MSRYITIITTVYNIAPYLERFFKCLGEQTFTDYEALIVDDGSTDNSLEICRAHAENDDRIRLVELEHTGISGARNTALGLLQTPFAASLDGDDFFERDYLKHLVDAQKKYKRHNPKRKAGGNIEIPAAAGGGLRGRRNPRSAAAAPARGQAQLSLFKNLSDFAA